MIRAFLADLVPTGPIERKLALPAFLQSVGQGVFLSSGVIFLHEVVGLSAGSVAAGLSVASLIGMACAVPIGRLADHYTPRSVLIINFAVKFALFLLYAALSNFWFFLIVASAISIAETSATPLRIALTKSLFGTSDTIRLSAQMRGLFNVGFIVGSAVAGVAVSFGGRAMFTVVFALTAIAELGCAFYTYRIPKTPAARLEPSMEDTAGSDGALLTKRRAPALRDGRYLLVTVLSGLMELYQPLLLTVVPLYIITSTSVPVGVNSVLLILNALLVALLQVRLSRGAETVSGSARQMRKAALFIAVSCVFYAFSAYGNAWWGTALLLGATIFLVFGETTQAAGAWGLSIFLSDPRRQGEYLSVFALGRGIQQTVGPVLLTALVIGWGTPGWAAFAIGTLVVGFLCAPASNYVRQFHADKERV